MNKKYCAKCGAVKDLEELIIASKTYIVCEHHKKEYNDYEKHIKAAFGDKAESIDWFNNTIVLKDKTIITG